MRVQIKIISIVLHRAVAFAVLVFVLSQASAQMSDSLFNALPQNIKPENRNNITITERKRILLALDTIDLSHYHTELSAIAVWLIKDWSTASEVKRKVEDLVATVSYYSVFSHDSSIFYNKQLLHLIVSDTQFIKLKEHAHLSMSTMYVYEDKYDSAIGELHLGLDIASQLGDSAEIVRAYTLYASIYGSLRRYAKAVYYAHRVLQLYPSSLKWDIPYTRYAINLAGFYRSLFAENGNNAYNDSTVNLLRAIMAQQKNNAANWYQACYYLLGYNEYKKNNYAYAMVLIDSCALPAYNKSSLFFVNNFYRKYIVKAACLIKLGFYKQGQKIAKAIQIGPDNYVSKQIVFQSLSDAAKALGNDKEALYYYTQYKLVSDSLNIQDQQGKVFEAEQQYQAEKETASIVLLENKNLQQKIVNTRITVAAVCIVLLLSVTALLLYQRNKRNQYQRELALANQRKTISANMHDEVNSSLAALRFLITDLKEHAANNETKNILADLEEEASGVYAHSRNFMHQIVGQDDEKEDADIIALLQKLSLRFNQNSGLQINVDVNEGDIHKLFTQQQHVEMGRIIKEAVANTMKYSGASKMYITIQKRKGRFWFEIKDNGHWAGGEDTAKGIGLTAIYSRISALKGHLNLTNNNGGTTISGSFPLKVGWWF